MGETGRDDVEAELAAREAGRETCVCAVRAEIGRGRAGVDQEHDRPSHEHTTEGVPFVGERLAAKLYGTARDSAPGMPAEPMREGSPPRRSGPDWGGP